MVEAEDPQHLQITRAMVRMTKTEEGIGMKTKVARTKREGTCEVRKGVREQVQEQVQEEVREVVEEEIPPSTTNPDVPGDALRKDQMVYTMIKGYTNNRKEPWVSIDNEKSEMEFQQFVYQPIIRDRSVSYILQI